MISDTSSTLNAQPLNIVPIKQLSTSALAANRSNASLPSAPASTVPVQTLKPDDINNPRIKEQIKDIIKKKKENFYEENMKADWKKCTCKWCDFLDAPYMIRKHAEPTWFEEIHKEYFDKYSNSRTSENEKIDNVFVNSVIVESKNK